MNQRRYNAPSAGLRFQASLGVLLKESFLGVFLLSDFSLKCLSDVIGLFKIWAAFLRAGHFSGMRAVSLLERHLPSGNTPVLWKYTRVLESTFAHVAVDGLSGPNCFGVVVFI